MKKKQQRNKDGSEESVEQPCKSVTVCMLSDTFTHYDRADCPIETRCDGNMSVPASSLGKIISPSGSRRAAEIWWKTFAVAPSFCSHLSTLTSEQRAACRWGRERKKKKLNNTQFHVTQIFLLYSADCDGVHVSFQTLWVLVHGQRLVNMMIISARSESVSLLIGQPSPNSEVVFTIKVGFTENKWKWRLSAGQPSPSAGPGQPSRVSWDPLI